ncbi:hypothetical protein ACO2Q5_22885, partial [Neotabrizicola sp. VNH66]
MQDRFAPPADLRTPAEGREPQDAIAPVGFDRPATLHLVSSDDSLLRDTAPLLGILRALPQERHLVLFTGPAPDAATLTRLQEAGGFVMPGLAAVRPGDHPAWLARRLQVLLPQRVMIHAAADDPLAGQAARRLAARYGRKLYLLQGHAAAGGVVPGLLGPELAGATHVLGPGLDKPQLRRAMAAAGYDGPLHLATLGHSFDAGRDVPADPPAHLLPARLPEPEPAEPGGEPGLRARLKSALSRVQARVMPAGGELPPLSTATAGLPGELAGFGTENLADLIVALVQATGARHYHIGPIDPPLWHLVQQRLQEQDLPAERVVFLGAEGQVGDHLLYHRVGLFLGSLPGVQHCAGLAGAAWARVPVARFRGGDGAQDGIGPGETLDWSGPGDLCRRLEQGLSRADRQALSEASGRWYRQSLHPRRFARRLAALLDLTEGRLDHHPSDEETEAALAALFDAGFYLRRYPDIAQAGIDPLKHYRQHGEAEGRSPNPLFHPWHYQARLPKTVQPAKGTLLAHYLLCGEARGFTPHPYFIPACAAPGLPQPEADDPGAADSFAARAAGSVLARYLRQGRGSVQPHPLFDPAHYARNLVLSAGDQPLLLHYLETGAEAGLSPHPLISPDLVRNWGASDLLSGLLYWLALPGAGPSEPSPDLLFDPGHLCGGEAGRYALAAPNMLWAHLIEGDRPDRGPHPLIDPAHVARRRPEVLTAASPILPEMAAGRMAGIDTHPLVSTAHIMAQAPWCGVHPTRHYVQNGVAENIDPHPWFSTAYYLSQAPDAVTRSATPLQDYLQRGEFDGLRPHPFFDSNHYWNLYLRETQGGDSLLNYARQGAGLFRLVQMQDEGQRRMALRTAQSLFAQEGCDSALTETLLKEALHPATASPHPTLQVETRPVCAEWPEGADRQLVLPATTVALSRPAVLSRGHVAPPQLRHDLPEVQAGICRRAWVLAGADGFGTQDGKWWPEGAETGPLPHSELAGEGRFALRPGTPVAARRDGAVLLRWHRPARAFAQAIFACGSGSATLDRFLLEVLPRAILAARLAPAGTPLLTESDLPAQALQALRLALPDHPVLQIPRGQAARIDRLFVAGQANRLEVPQADPAPDARPAAAALRLHPDSLALLRAHLAGPVPPRPASRLFLCADSLTSRRLSNAEEMAAALARCGFLRQDPGTMDFAGLAALVQGAAEIVATDCAQLAVLALARPGTRVWVLQGNAPGTDFHRWDTLGRLSGLEMVAVSGWQILGSAGAQNRPADAHYVVPVDLVTPFFETRLPQDKQVSRLLDALYGSSGAADVLTGAWAVHAGPTPAGFEDRLRHLRHRAALGISAAEAADLPGLMAHPFFADFARSIRSGFPVLAGLDGDEAALAAQLRASFAGETAAGPLPAAALSGPEGARRRLLLAMLLLPGWSVPLPDAAALPEDVVERHLAWAVAPAALIRAGEDAAWVRHVEALLHWLADRLADADLPEGLRLRLRRMAGRLDLGQLLLIDQPLRGVQEARNRVLDLITPGEDSAITEPVSAGSSGSSSVSSGRLRVGILCRTFEKGPDSEAVVAFLRGFDPARFEVFAYSIGFRDRVVSRDPAF